MHTGPSDILDNKLHLILGLVWQLILRYQMSGTDQSKLLRLFNALLPGRKITNFTTDWANGANLTALVEFCRQNKSLSPVTPANPVKQLSKAMSKAEEDLGVPKILNAEDIAVSNPSEKAVMTYLSYFFGHNSPGQRALLSWVQEEIPNENVTDFSTSWVDGRALGALTNVFSDGSFPDYRQMTAEHAVENCSKSMEAAERLLGVERIISPEEFASAELSEIERMTYLTQFRQIRHARTASISHIRVPDKAGTGEMVWLDLDCSGDSSETLEVVAKRNQGEHVPVKVDRLASNKYRIKYEVKQADIYTLDVRFGGRQMRGSPFKIDLSLPEVELIKTITPRRTHSPVLAFCKISHVHGGKITANVEGEQSGSHPIQMEEVASDEYKVSFIPPEPDLYTVSVLLDNKPLNGSPFVFPLHSLAQPEKVHCIGPVSAEVGKPVHFEIDTSKAGQGDLVATCKGEECGDIEVKVLGTDDQPNGITFIPPEYDLYTVSIFYAGMEVEGSPFEIDLQANAEKVIVVEPPTGGIDAGEVSMCIDTSNAGRGMMEIRCEGNKVGEITVTVEEQSPDQYRIRFTPPERDIYTVNVLLSGQHIPGSPFTVDLDQSDATKCKVIGLEAILSSPCFVNEDISFQVNAQEAGRGTLSVQTEMKSPQEQEEIPKPNVKVTEDEPRIYSIKYKPTTHGTHNMFLRWENESIPNSPLTFDVISPQTFPANPIVLDLKTDYKKEKLKTYAICKEDGSQHEVSIKELGECHLQLSFRAQCPGIYFVHVLDEDLGSEISGSPMVVRYTKEAFPEACQMTGFSSIASLGKPFTFTIDSKQAGIGMVTISQQSVGASFNTEETDTADSEFKLINDNSGTTLATYTPTTPGEKEISVAFAGIPISGSPFKLIISDPSQDCHVQGEGIVSAKAGEWNKFLVHTPGSSNGTLKLTVNIEGEGDTLNPTITEVSDEDYEVTYLPHKRGTYHAAILFGNAHHTSHIPGSKFEIPCKKIIAPSQLSVSEEVSTDDVGGRSVQYTVVADTEADGELTIFATSAESEVLTGEAEKKDACTYNCMIHPPKADTYTVHICWDEEEIHGSPFDIHVLPLPSDFYIEGVQSNQDAVTVLVCGPDTDLISGEGRGMLEASCDGDEVREVPITVEKQPQGLYSIKFTPPEPDLYTVNVLSSGTHIAGSPIIIDLARPNASKCKIVGDLPSTCLVNDEIQFKVSTTGAGKGQLDVQTESTQPQEQEEICLTHIDAVEEQPRMYTIKYKPTTLGTHKIHLWWQDDAIPGSPLTFLAISPQTFPGSPIILDLATEHKKETLKAYAICREDSSQHEVRMRKLDNSCLQLSLRPQHPGMYFVHVLNKESGNDISGSPMAVNYTREAFPENCGVTGFSNYASPGEPFTFTINSKNAGIGKVTVFPEHLATPLINEGSGIPDSKVMLTDKDDGTTSVVYTPTSPGEDKLAIMFAGIPIPGSPFKVTVSDPSKACRAQGEGLVSAEVGEWNKFLVHTPGTPSGNSKLIVEIEGEGEALEPTITAVNEKDYEVSYQPQKRGIYQIAVLFGNACYTSHIPGSKFKVPSKKIIAPDQLMVSKEVSTDLFVLGKPVQFTVETDTEADGDLTIFATHAEGEVLLGETEKTDHTTYKCSIDPLKADTYTVHISWDGEQIDGSPFDIQVVPPLEPKDFCVEGAESNQGAITLLVHGPNRPFADGDLTASLETATTAEEIPVTVMQGCNGKYPIQFQTKETDEHLVSIKFENENITGSPFKLVPTNALQCHARGKGLYTAQIAHWNKFSVYTESAGVGELTVEITGEGEEVESLISAMDETHYDVSYLPVKPGHYKISVQWDGNHIPKSPYQVYCCDPFQYSILHPRKVTTRGKAIECTVQVEKNAVPEFDTLKVYGYSKGRKRIRGKVTKTSNEDYLCSIGPPENEDTCTVHVRCNGFEIQGSPYKVKILPPPTPENVKAYGPGLEDGTVGQGTFTIDVTDAGYGFLNYEVQGPDGGFEIGMSRHDPDKRETVLAYYNPKHAGVYKIILLWAGTNIPGSPFTVTITE